MKRFFLAIFIAIFSVSINAQETARWLRTPAISPDGNTVAFSYMGNLYRVAAGGGTAVPITTGDAYDGWPVWSNDGKTIAFASDRYGNFDVFTMPATGGAPVRLTFNSTEDLPYDFTADDKQVLFGSGRNAPAESVRFPSPGLFTNLYTIPLKGGRPILVSAAGADDANFSKDGSKIVFEDRKGYEDELRKHHTSAVTRDIWLYDLSNNTYEQLSDFEGENREPVFSSDAASVYYLNERSGTQNLYKMPLSGGSEEQLSEFEDFPVRHLSISDRDVLSFTWKGDIYTLNPGAAPKKLDIKVMSDSGYEPVKNMDINTVTEFAVSPNNKEIAFVNRGEVFVTGVDDSRTKRVTNTPEQERMISWSDDGKTLLFSGERDGSWNVYKVTMARPAEEYFYASTILNSEPVIASEAEEFQPKYSPDGKKIAFIEERNILKVLDLDSKKKTTVFPEGRNYSYSDGDWSYSWSPDSNWLLVDDSKGYFFSTNTALLKADGSGEIFHPVNSGFGESNAKWAMDGKMMTYESSREGRRSLALQGSSEVDIYGVFFDQEAYDKYKLSKEEFELLNEKERKDKEEQEKKEKEEESKKKKKDKKEDKKPLELNLENLENRREKLTINSSSISDYVLNNDASKVYYLSSFEKGYDLWVTEPRTRETKILAKLGGSPSGIEISEDDKTLFLSNDGKLVKVDAESGEVTNIGISGDMMVDAEAEREYMFHHMWRQVKKKFYDPEIHGIDWEMYRDEYAKFLPYINNNYDFQQLLSELLGELNASHTGGRYRPDNDGLSTASLGLLYDEKYTGEGIKISEVIPGGPLDKANSKVKAGDIITAINGEQIEADENWNKYLLNLEDKNTLLTVKRGNSTFEEKLKPISTGAESRLMYKRWVNMMEDMVDSLSGGQLGYLHIQGMNDSSFRDVYENALGKNLDKKALVVDTRFNGGGWLHDDLNTFLSGEEYLKFAPQGNVVKGGEPMARWNKPSIVVMSEGNYSDAFIFPYIYKQNDIGKLVGMPVAGTGTAVWWERQIDPTIVFGIPMVATIGAEGVPTENMELQPDILVPLPYKAFLNGKDTQIEAAVRALEKEVSQE